VHIKTIKKASNLSGKRVLVRCDLNVPIHNGIILDDFKIRQALLTINFLLQKKAKVILLTHLGRVETEKDKKDLITQPIAAKLSKLLKKEVKYVDDCIGLRAGTAVSSLKNEEILLLENIRFESGETKNSKRLAKNLAKLADIFVFDAFGVAHRQHASIVAIRNYLPIYFGLLLESELINLNKIIKPKQPMVLVLGGVKLSTKLPIISRFLKKADKILIGGAMANNFLHAHGYETGKSLIDSKSVKLAKKLRSDNILLPLDLVVGRKNRVWSSHLLGISSVKANDYIFDIGPETIRFYSGIIKESQTILWNGPMGMFEDENYKHGTFGVGRTIAARSRGKAFGVVGGGETIEALKQTKMLEYIDWVSTGGGAMLTYLSGQKMPGLVQLKIKN
jgi:phosphoglycerate kinase